MTLLIGHRRSGMSLCRNVRILESVTGHTYDLTKADFVAYFIARTGYRIDKCKCGWADVVSVWANPAIPASSPYWAVTRGMLQDCWELWQISTGTKKTATMEPRGAGHTFGSGSSLSLGEQPEKPRPLLGDHKGM